MSAFWLLKSQTDVILLNVWPPQYGIPFYLQYLAHWPEYFIVAEAPGGELMGYSKFHKILHCLHHLLLTSREKSFYAKLEAEGSSN